MASDIKMARSDKDCRRCPREGSLNTEGALNVKEARPGEEAV